MKILKSFLQSGNEQNSQRQFLPAALEIVETPPNPAGRSILWAIMIFFSITVVWAIFGKVDIVAVAQGKIAPTGKVRIIQSFETGTIKTIHVLEDQAVRKGDALLDLDTTASEADRDRIKTERQAAMGQQARLQWLLAAIDQGQLNADWSGEVNATEINIQQTQADWNDYQSQLLAVKKQIEQRQGELGATRARIEQLSGTIPLISERAQSLKGLLKNNMVSRTRWLEIEEQRVQQVNERKVQRKQRSALQSSVAVLESNQSALMESTRSKWLANLSQIRTQISVYDKELNKAEKRNVLMQIKSPVDGVVKQLVVHTIGGVVTPAQEIMQIVPTNESLQVEAWIANKDIGFVEEGQKAEIKIDAFPFTKYGLIDGSIKTISNDAIANENTGLIFAAQVDMEKSSLMVNGKEVQLASGMTVSVEVKIGKRRLIEYLMSPLLRYKAESVRER